MDILKMAVPAAVILLAIVYGRWYRPLNKAFLSMLVWFRKIAFDPKTCGVLETFCVEASVLWFVFPLIDTLYDHRDAGSKLVKEAYAVAVLFLAFAVVLSHASKPKKEEE